MMPHTFNTESKLHGVGIGLRTPHLAELLDPNNDLAKKVPWLEILTDNYLNVGGFYAAHLQALSDRFPLTFHGVGLSIGSESGINLGYVKSLKKLADKHCPIWVSDHLSWSNYHEQRSHDLLPLIYTEEKLKQLCIQVNETQDILERPLLLENISAYYEHPSNTMNEAALLNELCSETGCHILLDANNLYVNHKNLGYDIDLYLDTLNFEHVKQIHLGGHEQRESLLVDTHGASICDDVWKLYEKIVGQQGEIATLIEWDNNVPSLEDLMFEREKAEQYLTQATRSSASQYDSQVSTVRPSRVSQ